jgi:hypothetical protein
MRTREEIERQIESGRRCLEDANYDYFDSKGLEKALNKSDIEFFSQAIGYLQGYLDELLSREEQQIVVEDEAEIPLQESHTEGGQAAKKWLEGDNSVVWLENFHYHV